MKYAKEENPGVAGKEHKHYGNDYLCGIVVEGKGQLVVEKV